VEGAGPLRSSSSEIPAKSKGTRRKIRRKIQVGTWDVHTMLRPGKLANVIREMKRANLDARRLIILIVPQ